MEKLETYWNSIPVGRENALTYDYLRIIWNCTERTARAILHELSLYDNGDNYILIRSGGRKGFYKTDDEAEIKAYKRECLNKGRSVLAPIKKINRVLNSNSNQLSAFNNLRVIRESRGLTQADVVAYMQRFDSSFDKPLLSKMENGICVPTLYQSARLAFYLDCKPSELLAVDLYTDV